MADTPASPDFLGLTAQIVSAHVSNNAIDSSDLPALIHDVFRTLSGMGRQAAPASVPERRQPAVPVKKSIFPDHIVCLEDGKKLKMLKRHLKTAYDLTPEQYRERWGLPSDYPMVAPNYASHRSSLAKKIGLGTKPREPARKERRAGSCGGLSTRVARIGYAGPRAMAGAREISQGEQMESRIERICVEHGLKMTGQRRVIARVLSDAEDHPDVEELYRRASALDGRISIATVYRTVRLLEERGILERRDFGGGRARYEPTEHGRHYHLIDIDTGRVIEFEGGEHERLMQQIASGLGFDLVSTRLEIYGRRRSGSFVHAGDGAVAAAHGGSEAAPRNDDPSTPAMPSPNGAAR